MMRQILSAHPAKVRLTSFTAAVLSASLLSFGCTTQIIDAAEPDQAEPSAEPEGATPEPAPEGNPAASPEGEPGVPSGPEPDPTPKPCPAEASIDALAESLLADLGTTAGAGASIAIACGDGTVVARGVGIVGVGGAPVTGDTLFQLASISKSLTGATAALMDADGTLSLDDPLTSTLSGIDLSSAGGDVTLRHLLAHNSGYTTDGFGGGDSLEAIFGANPAVPFWAEPGRVYNYSNYGYAMAGLAMERIAAEPFADLVTSRLLTPHNIDIRFGSAAVIASDDFALGHNGSGGELGPADSYYGAGWYGPMGGGWGSARSLATFAATILGDGDDGQTLRAVMPEPQIRTEYDSRVYYGQGLFVDDSGTTPIWKHDGGVEGFYSHYAMFPEFDVAVVILVNSDTVDVYPTTELAHTTLAQWDYSFEPPPPLNDVVGTYNDPIGLGTITIRESAGGLEAEFVDLDFVAPLEVWDVDTVRYHHTPYDFDVNMVFWRDTSGAVDLLSTWDGVAERQP